MNIVEIIIWEKLVGVLVWNNKTKIASFEFAPSFIKTGIELSPLMCPTSKKIIHSKSNSENNESIDFENSKGLPLFISDSLPDKFGTDLFSKYLEKEGKNYRNLSPLEKLSYIGNRGMGALEFKPANNNQKSAETLDLKSLNDLSISLLKNETIGNLDDLGNLFHIGTSPGGAQPKVLLNIDKQNGNIYRGDILPTPTQESWILKFNKNIGLESDKDRGKIEYAYYLMAKSAGINLMESRLLENNGEHFFMTQRFDRQNGEKIHTQTLHAFAGMNFKLPNTYSYEQIFSLLHQLKLDYPAKEQLFRLMVFNLISRNVDDHTKNFGFNRSQTGDWNFSPAYDLTFTYSENFNRPTLHFLSVNGKNSQHNLNDILTVAKEYSIKNPKNIINEVNQSLLNWRRIGTELTIGKTTIDFIADKMNAIPYVIK